ncbi:hypothetical protein SPI_06247 [Niveomyces insectorum RCEF 264]|uniref:Uncharacterized protein n=1 Tax=Niveomyces insectorum RCEF 264 TaxID=1081102 RepID=A0A167RXW5_9HYPO|nr:hypothetical protein SPI_06247 [Niveomyces insectorum RCEF 264]
MSANSLSVYVTVYEYKGVLRPQFTREFMRHSSILGLITEAEKEKAEEEQKKAIALPFASETPNKRALKD